MDKNKQNGEAKNSIVLNPGMHLLRFDGQKNAGMDDEFSKLSIDYDGNGKTGNTKILLPFGARKFWLLNCLANVTIFSENASVSAIGNPRCLFYKYFGTTWQKKKYDYKHVTNGEITFTAVGKRNKGAKVWSHLKALQRFGLLPNGRSFRNNTEIFEAPVELTDGVSTRCSNNMGGTKIAAVVHLHYDDLWPEFSLKLLDFPENFDLFVTITRKNKRLVEQIKKQFPGSTVLNVANRGRDIGPLFHLLREGHLAGYDLVCKVHAKKTIRDDSESLIGRLWRRTCILDLLGSKKQIATIIEMFRQDLKLGMVGPRSLRMPSSEFQLTKSWGENEIQTLDLVCRLGLSAETNDLDFFAGSMFWCRGDILRTLDRLSLAEEDFTLEENQSIDGRIEHALERIFGIMVRKLGYNLELAPDFHSDTKIAKNQSLSNNGNS